MRSAMFRRIFFCFPDPCGRILLLGVENGDAERVEEAARIAQLLPVIQSFGAGFDTVIGERGVRFRAAKSSAPRWPGRSLKIRRS